MATLLVLATTVACSGLSASRRNATATPAATRSGAVTTGPSYASPSRVASPTATVTPSSGIAAAGTAGPLMAIRNALEVPSAANGGVRSFR